MAEPARKLPEENQPEAQPRPKLISGSGQSTPRRGNLSSVPEPKESESHVPKQDQAVTKPNLRVLEGGGQSSDGLGLHGQKQYEDSVQGDLQRLEDQHTAKQVAEYDAAVPTKDLRQNAQDHDSEYQQAKRAGSSMPTADLREGGRDFNYRQETPSRRQRAARGLLFGFKPGANSKPMSSRRTKLLWGVGVLGGLGVGGILIILFIVGSLLIPNLAQHITEYQFARITRQFAESAERTTDEKLGLDAANDAAYDAAEQTFDSEAGSETASLWTKLNSYRPSQVINNLEEDKGFGLNYKTSLTGRQILTGVELDSATYEISQQGLTRFVPGLSSIIQFKNEVTFSKDFVPALDSALRDQEVGTIIRSVTAKEIRQKLGISLIAWVVGKYQGEDPTQARLTEEEAKVNDVDQPGVPDNSVSATDKSGVEAADAAEQAALTDPAQLQGAINSNGVLSSVKTAVSSAVEQSGLSDVLGVINPIYGVAMPICIIYDGSLDKSGPAIDNQTAQQQRAFYYIATAADQQKAGYPYVSGESDGATNADLNSNNDIAQSNPEIRASGGTVTTTQPSAEASADGEFTLLNATPGLSSVAPELNTVANAACPLLTNPEAAVAIGAGNIILGIFTGGTADGVEEAAGQAAAKAAETAADEVASDIGGTVAEETAGNALTATITKTTSAGRKFFNLLWDTGTSAGKIAGLTIVAKLVVLSRASQVNSGFAQGVDLANEGDSGGNIQAGELERSQLFGRPMLPNEVCQSNQDDTAFLNDQESQKSAFDRYLATSDADSLLSRTATTINSDMGGSLVGSFVRLIGSFLNPARLLGLFANLFGQKAFAATNCATDGSDYGNVQFGWSDTEENLIDSSDSYKPLENQQILDASNQEDAIAQTYAPCFGYKWNGGDGSLDPTDQNGNLQLDDGPGGSASLGTLLSSGDITRDSAGNVIANQGLCSPDNLGTDNPTYGDLVFRWRLAMQYDNTLDQLSQEQNVTLSQ